MRHHLNVLTRLGLLFNDKMSCYDLANANNARKDANKSYSRVDGSVVITLWPCAPHYADHGELFHDQCITLCVHGIMYDVVYYLSSTGRYRHIATRVVCDVLMIC